MRRSIVLDTPAAQVEPWAEHALQILLQVSDSMTAADGVAEALDRLAWLALSATPADRCAILVYDPVFPGRLLPAAGASRAGDLPSMWQRFRSMPPIDLSEETMRALRETSHAHVIEVAAVSDVIPDAWKRAWDSKSIAYAPLLAGGEMFGVLAVEHVQSRHSFDARELKLLDAIATAAGVAIRNTSLRERLNRAAAIERRLGESAAAVRSGRSLHEMLNVIADRFVALLPEVSCTIILFTSDGTGLRPVASRGLTPRDEIKIKDLPANDVETFERMWQSDPRQPILIPDVGDFPAWEAFIPPEIRAGMLLPLPDGNRLRGIVAVGRHRTPFSEEEVRLATAFADHATIALSQARLSDELRLRVDVLEALYLLKDTVARTADLGSVLTAVNERIRPAFGLELLRVTFRDPMLAGSLSVPVAGRAEQALLRRWRQSGPSIEPVGDELAVCVPVRDKPGGILWVQGPATDDSHARLLGAIATEIGELARKATAQRAADTDARRLAVAADRERMARDLHDTVGQTLYGIGLKLQDIAHEIDDPGLAERIGAVRALAARGVADVRSAVYALSFLHVRDQGLVPSLETLARQFEAATRVNVRCLIASPLPALDPEVESALYRVTHEALVNVERHARATGIVLRVDVSGGQITLTVRDDGVGIDQRDVGDWRSAAHFGMRTMAKSIEQIGGSFRVEPAYPRGLVISAAVPLRPGRTTRR